MRKNEKQTLLPEILRGVGVLFLQIVRKNFLRVAKGCREIPLEEGEAKR